MSPEQVFRQVVGHQRTDTKFLRPETSASLAAGPRRTTSPSICCWTRSDCWAARRATYTVIARVADPRQRGRTALDADCDVDGGTGLHDFEAEIKGRPHGPCESQKVLTGPEPKWIGNCENYQFCGDKAPSNGQQSA